MVDILNRVVASSGPTKTLWLTVFVMLLLGASIAGVFWIRHQFGPGDQAQYTANTVFTLEQIGVMRRRGQISQLEYETLRNQIIHQM